MIKVDTKEKWLALHKKYEKKYEEAYLNNETGKLRYYCGKLSELDWSWQLYCMKNWED